MNGIEIVEITEKARLQILKIFKDQGKDQGRDSGKECLRIGVIGGGCSGLSYKMDFGEIKEKDHLFLLSETDDHKMAIDPKSAIYLKGVRLDFEDGLKGKGFVFINPNAKSTCGCGESFSV